MFSTLADFSRPADSQSLFARNGLPGTVSPLDPNKPITNEYAPQTDPRDPVLSPMFADLHGMPPTLLVTSTPQQYFHFSPHIASCGRRRTTRCL